jgi:hypothetical protein
MENEKNKKYGIVLIEKPNADGLSIGEVVKLLAILASDEVYPVDIDAASSNSSVAMGFVNPIYARKLGYDYEKSGLIDFISDILNDMDKENETHEYEYEYNGNVIPIYLTR